MSTYYVLNSSCPWTPPLYYVRLAKPAHSIQRSFFFVALVIATCVHYSPQHCWGFEAVSINELVCSFISKLPEVWRSRFTLPKAI